MTLGNQVALAAVFVGVLSGCAETTSCEEPKYGTVCGVDREGHDDCWDARYPPPALELVEADYQRP